MKKDCPMLKAQGRESAQAQTSAPNPDALNKKSFYALHSRGDQKRSSNVVTGMLLIFSINIYALLDPDATWSFIIPLVDMKFDVLPNVLDETF